MTAAQGEVRAAAEAALLSEAASLAEKVLELEADALALRVRLGGGSFSPIATRGVPIPEALAAVLASTDAFSDTIARRGDLWNGVKASAAVWAAYTDRLMADPGATLNFDEPAAEERKAAA